MSNISESIRVRLDELHKLEDEFNKEMAKIDWEIKQLVKKKAVLAKRISHNMRFRNKLITENAIL